MSEDLVIRVAAYDAASMVLDGIAEKIGVLGGLGIAAGAGVAALGVGLANAAGAAASFNAMLTTIGNNTGLTTAQVQQLQGGILDLANQTGAPIEQIAHAFEHAQNVTQDFTASMAEAKAGTESAISTGADAADVTNMLSSVMHEYGLDVSHAGSATGQYNEVLARSNTVMGELHIGTQLANTTLGAFTDAQSKAIGIAANMGVGLNDVLSVTAALTKHGFPDVNVAGTQVTDMLTHMLNPGAAAKAALQELANLSGTGGVASAFDAQNLAARGLVGTIDYLRQAEERTNLTEAEREQLNLRIIPALRGGLGFAAELGTAYDDTNANLAKLNDTTAVNAVTQESFNKTLQTAAGQWDVLKANLSTARIELGERLQPVLVGAIQALNGMLPGVKALGGLLADTLGPAARTAADVLGAVANAVKAVAAIDASSFFLALSQEAFNLGLAFDATKGPLTALADFLFGTLPQAASAAGAVLSSLGQDLDTAFTSLKSGDFTTMWAALRDALSTVGDVVTSALSAAGDLAGRLTGWLSEQWRKIDWAAIWRGATGLLGSLAAALGDASAAIGAWARDQWAKVDWASVWQGAKGIAADIGTALGDLSIALTTWLGAQWAKIDWTAVWVNAKGVADTIGAALADIDTEVTAWLRDQWSKVRWTVVWAATNPNQGIDSMPSAGPGLTAYFRQSAKDIDWGIVASSMLDGLTAAVQSVTNRIRNLDATAAGEALGQWLARAAEGLLERVAGVLVPVPIKIGAALADGIRQIDPSEAGSALGSVLQHALGTALAVGDLLAHVATNLAQIAKGIASGINDVLGVQAESVGKAIITMIASAISGAQEQVVASSQRIGTNIVDGIAAGIRGSAGQVIAAAQAVAGSIPDAIANLLGIRSPSTVLMAQGEQAAAGLNLGLLGGIKVLQSTSAQLSGTVEGAATDFLGQIDNLRFGTEQKLIDLGASVGSALNGAISQASQQIAQITQQAALTIQNAIDSITQSRADRGALAAFTGPQQAAATAFKRQQEDADNAFRHNRDLAQATTQAQRDQIDLSYRNSQEDLARRRQDEDAQRRFSMDQQMALQSFTDSLADQALARQIARTNTQRDQSIKAINDALTQKEAAIKDSAAKEEQALKDSMERQAAIIQAQFTQLLPALTAQAQASVTALLAWASAAIAGVAGLQLPGVAGTAPPTSGFGTATSGGGFGSFGGGGGSAAPISMTDTGGFVGPAFSHASGGPVLPNYPIRVGEHGVELWMPTQPGSIVPNNQLGGIGGGVTINLYGTYLGDDRAMVAQLASIINPELKRLVNM